MSDVWTKKDAGIMAYLKLGRTYTHPTDLQRLFHTDEELEFQGESPWLPYSIRKPFAPPFGVRERIHAKTQASLKACAQSIDPKEDLLQCFSPDARRLRFIRRYAQRGDWRNFVGNYQERNTIEGGIGPELSEAIQASREILQLQDNWDTEGSLGYSEATWNRATTFLATTVLRYWKDHQRGLLIPRILPGPDGNIDLHWQTPQRELLISIPADPEEAAAYYGDDREDGTDNAIRGKGLDTSRYNDWIFAWLMR